MSLDLGAEPWKTFDGPSLASAAAALQLLPENRYRFLRLQRLALIGAALPPRANAPWLSPSRIRQALRSEPISEFKRYEDDPDDLFIAEVPFHGGPNLVIQGLMSQSAHTISVMLRAIFRDRSALPATYINDAGILAKIFLKISNLICRRAGLYRGQNSIEPTNDTIFVPGRERLAQLTRTILLTYDDLARLLPSAAIPFIQELTFSPGENGFTITDPESDQLVITPFMWSDAGVVVINPGELTDSLRHHLITCAARHNCQPALAEAYRAEVVEQTLSLLELLDADLIGPKDSKGEALISRHRFSLADDKIIDLAIVTDNLENYSANEPHSVWDVPDLGRRVQEVIDPSGPPDPEDERTLRLVIQESPGRTYFMGFDENRRSGPILVMQLEELKVIAALDGNDPLLLWRFAQADNALQDEAKVMSFGVLDRYSAYRFHEYSYYLSDDKKPNFISFTPGSALPLREEAQILLDPHEVASPRNAHFIEVVAQYGIDKAPIYFPHPRHSERALLVESGEARIWISTKGGQFNSNADLRKFSSAAIEAVAYWVWQASLAWPDLFESAMKDSSLLIELDFGNADAWAAVLSGSPPGDPDKAWAQPTSAIKGSIGIRLNSTGANMLASENNQADRSLLNAALESVSNAADRPLSNIESLLNEVAPLGRKKILRFTKSNSILLRPGQLPKARLVQPAVTSIAVDKLGSWLSSRLSAGPIPDDKRNEVLGDAVRYYFSEIERRVADLCPDGLIEYLVKQDEARLFEDAREEDGLAYRLACFGEFPDLVEKIADSEQRRAEAAIAGRFLIEYVAARPPSGDCKITLDIYDHLMALAAEIYSRATLSDAIRYGFSECRLALLESGRLGMTRGDRFEAGTRASRAARAEATHQVAIGPKVSRDGLASQPPSEHVESAMDHEFGFTLNDLMKGLIELVALGNTIYPIEPYEAPIEEVISHLRENLDWSHEKTCSFVDRLTLKERPSFLSVGTDAYPWRYNREWSYLRRPLIQVRRPGNFDTLVWGSRRVWSAGRYWVDLIYTGRMRARSKELAKLMGAIRQDENKDFENTVAETFTAGGCSIVKAGVAKIWGKKLQSKDGRDLGDIDAIGISPTKKVIFVAEAKDFELARIPIELSNEAKSLLQGNKSALLKLGRRTQWIKEHLPMVIKHFRITEEPTGWTVRPVIVTSRDLISPRILPSDIPVVPIDALKEWVGRHLKSSTPPPRNNSKRKK